MKLPKVRLLKRSAFWLLSLPILFGFGQSPYVVTLLGSIEGELKVQVVTKKLDKAAFDNTFYKLTQAQTEVQNFAQQSDATDDARIKQLVGISQRYLNAVAQAAYVYARIAHRPESKIQDFSFDRFRRLSVFIPGQIGGYLANVMPFNLRHRMGAMGADSVEFEVFISETDLQLAEFLALNSISNARDYGKLVEFSSIKSSLNNRWAINRILGSKPIPSLNVASCGRDFMSFRFGLAAVPGVERSSKYKELFSNTDDYELLNYRPYKEWREPFMKSALLTVPEFQKLIQETYLDSLAPATKQDLATSGFSLGAYDLNLDRTVKDLAQIAADSELSSWQEMSPLWVDKFILPQDQLSPEQIAHLFSQKSFEIRSIFLNTNLPEIIRRRLKIPDQGKRDLLLEKKLAQYRRVSQDRLETQMIPLIKQSLSTEARASYQKARYQAKVGSLKNVLRSVAKYAYAYELVRREVEQSIDTELSNFKPALGITRESLLFPRALETPNWIENPDYMKNLKIKPAQFGLEITNPTDLRVFFMVHSGITDFNSPSALDDYFFLVQQAYLDATAKGPITPDAFYKICLILAHQYEQKIIAQIPKIKPTYRPPPIQETANHKPFVIDPKLLGSMITAKDKLNALKVIHLDGAANQNLLKTRGFIQNAYDVAILSRSMIKQVGIINPIFANPFDAKHKMNAAEASWTIYNPKTKQVNESLLAIFVSALLARTQAAESGQFECLCQATIDQPAGDGFRKAFRGAELFRTTLQQDSPKYVDYDKEILSQSADNAERWTSYKDSAVTASMWALLAIPVILIAPIFLAPAICATLSMIVMSSFAYTGVVLGTAGIASRFYMNQYEIPAQIKYERKLLIGNLDSAASPRSPKNTLIGKALVADKAMDLYQVSPTNSEQLKKMQEDHQSALRMGLLWDGMDAFMIFGGLSAILELKTSNAVARYFEKPSDLINLEKNTLKRATLRDLAKPTSLEYSFMSEAVTDIATKEHFFKTVGAALKVEELQTLESATKEFIKNASIRLNANGELQGMLKFSEITANPELTRMGFPLKQLTSSYLKGSAAELEGIPPETYIDLVPKSFFKAMGKGQFKEWATRFGSRFEGILKLRGDLITNTKINPAKSLLDKLEILEPVHGMQTQSELSIGEYFLRELDPDELAILGEITKRNRFGLEYVPKDGAFAIVQQKFKDMNTILHAMSPTEIGENALAKEYTGQGYLNQLTHPDATRGAENITETADLSDLDDFSQAVEFYDRGPTITVKKVTGIRKPSPAQAKPPKVLKKAN